MLYPRDTLTHLINVNNIFWIFWCFRQKWKMENILLLLIPAWYFAFGSCPREYCTNVQIVWTFFKALGLMVTSWLPWQIRHLQSHNTIYTQYGWILRSWISHQLLVLESRLILSQFIYFIVWNKPANSFCNKTSPENDQMRTLPSIIRLSLLNM